MTTAKPVCVGSLPKLNQAICCGLMPASNVSVCTPPARCSEIVPGLTKSGALCEVTMRLALSL